MRDVKRLDLHRLLLGGTGRRLDIFQQAIGALVREGDLVVDLGSGTGVLAFFACRAGARRVYAIEADESRRFGEVLARDNGFADRVEFIGRRSEDITLPERADVLISDTFGTFGFKSTGIGSLLDARNRLLKSDGRMMPNALELFLVPVEAPALYREHVDFWTGSVNGINLAALRPVALGGRHPVRFAADMLLADAVPIVRLDLTAARNASLHGRVTMTIRRPGVMHGFGGWFKADLAAGFAVSNEPEHSTTNYKQAFFPLAQPAGVNRGDVIDLTFSSLDHLHWRWQARSGERSWEGSTSADLPAV